MSLFLKDDRIEQKANRQRGWLAVKMWVLLVLAAVLLVTVWGNWSTVGTGNVISFYMLSVALIIHMIYSVIEIWSKKK